jgi:hypothetical protein
MARLDRFAMRVHRGHTQCRFVNQGESMRTTLKFAALAVSLSLIACDDAEKKAAEAKAVADKAAAEAKAAAEKKAAEAKAMADKAAAEALTKAKEALGGQKAEWVKKIDEGVAAMDKTAADLKKKAAKLPAKVKAKADEAFKAFDAAKASVVGLKDQIAKLEDPGAFADLTTKATDAISSAQKALEQASEAIMPPKAAPKKK